MSTMTKNQQAAAARYRQLTEAIATARSGAKAGVQWGVINGAAPRSNAELAELERERLELLRGMTELRKAA